MTALPEQQPAPPVSRAPNLRKPVSHRLVWVGLTLLAIAILAVFGIGYWVLVKYEPRAALHIPGDAEAAIRVDVEQVVLYEPLRRHLFPVLDGAKFDANRLQRLKELSGVNLGMDLREVVVAALPDGEMVVLVGGLFPKVGLLPALEQVLSSAGNQHPCSLAGAVLRCSGAVVVQADDGVLVIATNERSLDSAVEGSDWATRWNLPNAPLALVANKLERLALPRVVGGNSATPAWVAQLTRLTASTDLGDPLRVEVAFDGLGPERVRDVTLSLEVAQRWMAANPGPDAAGERAVLARAEVHEANGRPVVRSSWARADMDRLVRVLADVVAAILAPSEPRSGANLQ